MGRVELHDVWPNIIVFGRSVTRHVHGPNRLACLLDFRRAFCTLSWSTE